MIEKILILCLYPFLSLSFFLLMKKITRFQTTIYPNLLKPNQMNLNPDDKIQNFQSKTTCWHQAGSSPEKELSNGYHAPQMTKSKRFGKITFQMKNTYNSQTPNTNTTHHPQSKKMIIEINTKSELEHDLYFKQLRFFLIWHLCSVFVHYNIDISKRWSAEILFWSSTKKIYTKQWRKL